MDEIAEEYLNNTLPYVEIHLVSIIVYNETKAIDKKTEDEIKKQILKIIEKRYKGFDKSKIDIEKNPILQQGCIESFFCVVYY